MKLVYFIKSLSNSGGTERVLSTKVNYLCALGHSVTIITTEQNSQTPSFYNISDDVTQIHLNLNFENTRNRIFLVRFILYMYKLSKYRRLVKQLLYKIDPDVSSSLAGYEASFLHKLKKGGRKIIEMHFNKGFRLDLVKMRRNSSEFSLFIAKLNDMWLTHSAKKYDYLVSLTNADMEIWRSFGCNAVSISNSVSVIPLNRSTQKNNKIIAVGRMVPEKGFIQLLDIWKRITGNLDYNQWVLEIYGSGEYQNEYKAYIKNNSVNRVQIYDSVEDIYEKYLKSDIFVSSAIYEPFGMCIIEAMSCALPIVAFDCDYGPREIIDNNSGYLIPLGHSKMFEEKLLSLMASRNNRIELGLYSREKVIEKYSQDIILSQWVNLYERVTKH